MRLYNIVFLATILLLPYKKGDLVLQVSNIETPSGSLRVAIYDSEQNFLIDGNEISLKIAPVKATNALRISISDLPFGKYAIAIYHDVNNNGQLDKNYLGIPIEPYAFSNNPKVKWRSPTFTETQVELDEAQKDLSVELKRWRKH